MPTRPLLVAVVLIVGGAAVAAFLWLREPGRGVESNTGTDITGATQDLPSILLANVAAPKVVPSGTRLGRLTPN